MTKAEDKFEPGYRVLSIQSHTVRKKLATVYSLILFFSNVFRYQAIAVNASYHFYVPYLKNSILGNKAAVFPLQTLGYDVDFVNTVQFSNHTAYPSWTGKKFSAEDIQALFDGLEQNELTGEYTHVLTGYIGNYAILEKIELMVKKLKLENPNLIYVCDTVMGDEGALYVSPEIVPLYRDIMRISDVVTPNQFEAEILTEMKIKTMEDVCKVSEKLHSLGSPNVIITTLSLPLDSIPLELRLESSDNESLYCFTSQKMPNGQAKQHMISFPTYKGYFTGTGDLMSSLVVARFTEKKELVDAAFQAICSVNAITKKTYLYQQKCISQEKLSAPKLVHRRELLLIQGKKFIENPHLEKVDIKYVEIKP
ncbi:Ribokinase-like protein [Sporodiniella umbellata]|nr:Ribokinase-like protein [Sporodiniella umbellata]